MGPSGDTCTPSAANTRLAPVKAIIPYWIFCSRVIIRRILARGRIFKVRVYICTYLGHCGIANQIVP